jgi:hypothetical protein
MQRQLKETAFSSLGHRNARLTGRITKPLTCRRQRKAHTSRKCRRSRLNRFASRGAFSVRATTEQCGDPYAAPARHAIPSLRERSGFSRRSF